MRVRRRRGRRSRIAVWLLIIALLLLGRTAVYKLYPLEHWPVLSERALDAGLDPLFVAAVIRTESGWDADAVSGPGARGLMQVMPATATEVARHLNLSDFTPDMLFEPAVNIHIGTYYLAALRREFDGNVAAALAAYNGGARHVHDWLQSGRWAGTPQTLDAVPFPETREFVRRVLRDADTYDRLFHPDGSRRW